MGRSLAAAMVRRTSLLVDRVARPPAGVSILTYHRVGGGTASSGDLPVDEFRRQLDHLRNTCRVITLDEAVRGLSREDRSVEPSVVITFDGGSADFADVVVPELVARHLPATLYVATEFVDEQRDFPWGAPPVSWAGLRDACSTGLITVGSHTHSHRLLDRAPVDVAGDDIRRSVELIGSHLGRAAMHFAYPMALPPSAANEALVATMFRSAALARSRVNQVGSTALHRLWRTPIQRGDSPRVFAREVSGGMRLEGSVRAAAASRRTRAAT